MRPGARPPVHWIAGPLSARYVALATGGRPPTAKALPEAQDRIAAATAHLATPTAPSTRRICSTPCANTNDITTNTAHIAASRTPGLSRPLPDPITRPATLTHLNVRRHDRLGGLLHEYRKAA
jgi:hypothetical protein